MCRNRDSAVSGVKCTRAFLADQDSRVAGLGAVLRASKKLGATLNPKPLLGSRKKGLLSLGVDISMEIPICRDLKFEKHARGCVCEFLHQENLYLIFWM